MIHIGTAGWSIPKAYAGQFPARGSHLERYALRFTGVEINTSFYRPHRPATYARWAGSVPEDFRFAVKVPKEITHVRRLSGAEDRLESFLSETAGLGEKLGPLLVQLPPSLRFNAGTARAFFAALRERYSGGAVCEPRHASWFSPEAEALLVDYRIARAAADPAPHPSAGSPGGWASPVYYRLHGSPVMYYSAYPPEALDALGSRLFAAAGEDRETWCIFDNTAEGAATVNGLELLERLRRGE